MVIMTGEKPRLTRKLTLYDRGGGLKKTRANNIRYLFDKRWGGMEEFDMFCQEAQFIWNWGSWEMAVSGLVGRGKLVNVHCQFSGAGCSHIDLQQLSIGNVEGFSSKLTDTCFTQIDIEFSSLFPTLQSSFRVSLTWLPNCLLCNMADFPMAKM